MDCLIRVPPYLLSCAHPVRSEGMLIEDLFEQLRSHTYIPVTLDELSSTPQACLQAFDHLFRQIEADRLAAVAKESEGQAKTAHLSSSINHLTNQNAILQTRLLASLDALSATNNGAIDALKEENDALRLVNGNLALRLQDAYNKQSELRDTISILNEPIRAINSDSAKRRACAVATEHIAAVRIFAETQQDDDAISDAGTETQAHYQGNDVYANAEAGSSTARPPSAQSDPRLRTRTILLELANELESSRKEMAALQMEMEQSSSILQAQIDNRNKELATLYTQLDRFFGLPGFALTKGGKEGNLANQDTDVAKEIDTGELVATLRCQLQDLKRDIERLTAEKDNLARYGSGQASGDILGRFDPRDSPYIAEAETRLAEQQASFDGVARRARERLVEQERLIQALRNDLSRAQESMQSMHIAQEEEDVFSARFDSRQLSMADRAALGGSIPRPRSAYANPHAGSKLFADGLPALDGR